MTHSRAALASLVAALSISATAPAPPPGQGVLCLGTFVYFAEKTGKLCRPGEDSEFQSYISGLSKRFDDYIVRNSGGDPARLAKFKSGQNLDSTDRTYMCEGDIAELYQRFKKSPRTELDDAVDELLKVDGPPTFGDCV